MKKRLYRNKRDGILGGVCAGLGDYLGIDPIFIRIFLVLWTIFGEHSILVYLILWLIVPLQSDDSAFHPDDFGVRIRQVGAEIGDIAREPGSKLFIFTGAGLILWGVFYLLNRLEILVIPSEYSWYIWPAVLILAGIFVLLVSFRRKK